MTKAPKNPKERKALVASLNKDRPTEDPIDDGFEEKPEGPIVHELEELETLKIQNLSLQQELVHKEVQRLHSEIQRLQLLMGGVVQDVRNRLDLGDDVTLELNRDFKTMTQHPKDVGN